MLNLFIIALALFIFAPNMVLSKEVVQLEESERVHQEDVEFLDSIGVENWKLESIMGTNGKNLAEECIELQKEPVKEPRSLFAKECVNLLKEQQSN